MVKIVVFDSGFGSLSIVQAIRRHARSELIYYADQKNYPYGNKSKEDLEKIIRHTITKLQTMFDPDVIVVGSNTPSLLFPELFSEYRGVVGVFPPLVEAGHVTKTGSIAMLVTTVAAQSVELRKYIQTHSKPNAKVLVIDSSELVDLVESGKFIMQKEFCIKKIISVLGKKFDESNVDVVTLSSTHLPFLLPILNQVFSQIRFLDPADDIARQIAGNKLFSMSDKNTLKIFSTGDAKRFQEHLRHLGFRNKVWKSKE